MLSKRQKEILDEHRKKLIEWVHRPSKFQPEPSEPLIFSREIKGFKNDKNNREFGANTHTSWENFQKTIRSNSYQKVIRGTKFKGLKPRGGDWTFKRLDPTLTGDDKEL